MADLMHPEPATKDARSVAITRRQACSTSIAALIGLLGLAAHAASPSAALGEESTAEALAEAESEYALVQAQLDELAWQYEAASLELDETMAALEWKRGEVEQTQAQIDATQLLIDEKQAELEVCQNQLANVMSVNYKAGNATALDVIMASADFDELFENIYYLNKVSDDEAQLIDHTREVKEQLEAEQAALENYRATLEVQYSELNALREQQEWQLEDMRLRQDETYDLLMSLDEEVRALTDQYNAELIAQAEAAAAARAAAYGGESYGSSSVGAVIDACNYTPSPGSGLCAAWVTNVFSNAGIGYWGGDACDMYASWCYSSDQGSIQPGMIVAVSTWTGTSAGRIYGHVGVYVGGGMVMDNIGYIRSIDLNSWVNTYGTTVAPRWGWFGGVALA